MAGKGTVLADNEAADTLEPEAMSGANFGRSIYKNLMNGVSHMLPFVVAGGVLIAISFAVWESILLIQIMHNTMLQRQW